MTFCLLKCTPSPLKMLFSIRKEFALFGNSLYRVDRYLDKNSFDRVVSLESESIPKKVCYAISSSK